jgi:hypothetical protein
MFVPVARRPDKYALYPFYTLSSGSHTRYCTAPSTPGIESAFASWIPPGTGAESVYDKKGRGVFLMVLLESSTFCKAVEKSWVGREFSELTRGQIIDNVFYQ